MRGGALPPALICLALAFALAFASRRALPQALLAAIAAALAASRFAIPAEWDDAVFLSCWSSVLVTALCVHLPNGLPTVPAVVLALNAGLWTGAVTAAAGGPADLLIALPLLVLAFPGASLRRTGKAIALKVLASWLVAVAILAAALSVSPLTPGYEPDHME